MEDVQRRQNRGAGCCNGTRQAKTASRNGEGGYNETVMEAVGQT